MLTSKAIYSLLSGNSTVNSMTGGVPASGGTPAVPPRIAPNFEPKLAADFPNIYFYSESIDQQVTMDGPTRNAIEDTVRIVVQATSYADMVALSSDVIGAMSVTRLLVGGIGIQGSFFKGSSESEINIPDLGDAFVTNVNELEFLIIFDLPSA